MIKQNIKVSELIEELKKYDPESSLLKVCLTGAELLSWRNDPKSPPWVKCENRYKHNNIKCECGFIPWEGDPF